MINFEDPQIRYLIDYANIKQGLIKNQNNFLNKKQLYNFFDKPEKGFPLLLPKGIKFFDYSHAKSFYISHELIKKKIFNIKKKQYIGLDIFFKFGNQFYSNARLKPIYKKKLNKILKFNNKTIKKIKNYNSKIKTAFQTRNIPHLGHEKIFQEILKESNLLFINPLIGLKKKGDCTNLALNKAYNFLMKKYKNKIIYAPIIANMHYAGPREACHHILLRKKIGFNMFSIGRDHAGADNAYKPLEAYNLIKKKKFSGIKIFLHKGAYFCKKCNEIVLKNKCSHKKLTEISGSVFRKKLENKLHYKFARKELENVIHKIIEKTFYN